MTLDFGQLVETSADAIMASDAAGHILFWNAACERLFGFSAAEAVGQSLDIIIPARQQGRHWEGYHQTMASGITKYGASVLRVPAVHQAGHRLSIAFTVSLLKSGDGAVTGIVAIVRDESAQFEQQQLLRQRITELEANQS